MAALIDVWMALSTKTSNRGDVFDMNDAIVSEHPRTYGVVAWAAPLLLLGILVATEVQRVRQEGWLGWDTFWVWFAEGLTFLVVCAPLILLVKTVTVDHNGLTIRRPIGRTTMPWDGLKLVAIFDTSGRPGQAKRVIRIKPRRGRAVSFSNAMSNYAELELAVDRLCPIEIRRRPTFMEAILWGAP